MQHMERFKIGAIPTKIKQSDNTLQSSDGTADSAETINKDSKPPKIPLGRKLLQMSQAFFKLNFIGNRKRTKEIDGKLQNLEPKINKSYSAETNYVDSVPSQRLTPSSMRHILQTPITISKDKSMGSSSTFSNRFGSLETRSSSYMSVRGDSRDLLPDRKRGMHPTEAQQVTALSSIKEIRDVRKRREISVNFKRAILGSEPNLGKKITLDTKSVKSESKLNRKWGSVSEKPIHNTQIILESREISAREQFEFIERKRSLTTHVAVTRLFTKTYQVNTCTSAAGEIITSEEKVNQYHLYNTIGTGAFGRVVLARDDQNDEYFACKIISKKRLLKKLRFLPLSGNERLEIIKAEIAILKKVSHHPNIITLVEVLESNTDENLYMFFELCLRPVMVITLGVPATIIPNHIAHKYFRDVVLGLEFLHFNNIIHYDIKPENLLVDSHEKVKIGDFGISLDKTEKSKSKIRLINGSPMFASPEYLSGNLC